MNYGNVKNGMNLIFCSKDIMCKCTNIGMCMKVTALVDNARVSVFL